MNALLEIDIFFCASLGTDFVNYELSVFFFLFLIWKKE